MPEWAALFTLGGDLDLSLFLEDISPFVGATDTPLLDFWWCLLWVSMPEWAALFTLGGDLDLSLFFGGHKSFLWGPLIPLFWTSGDVSSEYQSQSGQPYLCLVEAYVLHILWDWWGSNLGPINTTSHSVRPGICSTNWTILVRHSICYLKHVSKVVTCAYIIHHAQVTNQAFESEDRLHQKSKTGVSVAAHYCLSNRKFERLGGPFWWNSDRFCTQIQRHNATS